MRQYRLSQILSFIASVGWTTLSCVSVMDPVFSSKHSELRTAIDVDPESWIFPANVPSIFKPLFLLLELASSARARYSRIRTYVLIVNNREIKMFLKVTP